MLLFFTPPAGFAKLEFSILNQKPLAEQQQHSENEEVVTLNPGLSKTLQSDKDFKTLVVGNSELADAIPHSGRSFTLTGKQEGRTTVIAVDGELKEIYSTIVVIAAPPKQIETTASDAIAQPQPKQDLLGFFLGMSEAQFMEQAAAAGCKRRYTTKLVWAREECSAPDGSMVLTFTDKIEERWILKEIQFKFTSGTGPEQMIAQVGEQFRGKHTKADWSAEISRAKSGRREYMRAWYLRGGGDYVWVHGGTISEWSQGNGLILSLSLNQPDAPNEYILTLTGGHVPQAEREAARRRLEEQEEKARSINPAPRF